MKDPNTFLYAISAMGEMKREDFNSSFFTLCLDAGASLDDNIDPKWEALRYLQILESLGHIEVEHENIYPCPPTLAIVRGSPDWALFCGSRDPEYVNNILGIVDRDSHLGASVVRQCLQSDTMRCKVLFPDAIFINGDTGALEGLSRDVGAIFSGKNEIAKEIADFSFSLNDYEKSLTWDKRAPEDPVGARESGFSTSLLKFYWKEKETSPLVEYKFKKWDVQFWYWDGDKGAVVDKTWGRYLALSRANIPVLVYCKTGQWLAVPSAVPLPVLLRRAATLCSGLVPYRTISGDISEFGLPNRIFFDVYVRVPPKIASLIAKKVGQDLIQVNIGPKNELVCL